MQNYIFLKIFIKFITFNSVFKYRKALIFKYKKHQYLKNP